MKEALLGFSSASAGGVVVGVLLGQVTLPRRCPRARTSRWSTRSRGSCSARSSWSRSASARLPKVLLAAVLVFFVVFFNAFQGVREVDRNLIANARVLGASRLADHPARRAALRAHLDHRQPARRLRLRDHRRDRRRIPRAPSSGLGLVIATSQNNFNPDGVFAIDAHHRDHRPHRRGAHRPARTTPARLAPALGNGARRRLAPLQAGRAIAAPAGHRPIPASPETSKESPMSGRTLTTVLCTRRASDRHRRLRQLERRERTTGSHSQPADRDADGRRHRQADLPALPARAGPRLLQEVRRQRAAQHGDRTAASAPRRNGIWPGRYGRRLVRAHDRLPAEGQERRRRRPAQRRARRARDVREGHENHTHPPSGRARQSA